jgi:hypothetical protein
MRDEWLGDLGVWAAKNNNVRELWLFGSRANPPFYGLESRPNRRLQPAKLDNRHFRDYPPTGHAADMTK